MAVLRSSRLFAAVMIPAGDDPGARADFPLYTVPAGYRAILRSCDIYAVVPATNHTLFFTPAGDPNTAAYISEGTSTNTLSMWYWRGHLVLNAGDHVQCNVVGGAATIHGSGALLPIQN